jgi:NAD(P)-dependent dehydrogenase (short-subunit alcohol dehydrogenase family)
VAKIFITGSTDGIGLEATRLLLEDGHEVVLHARNKKRADELQTKLSKPCKVLIADLNNLDEVKRLAYEVNSLGKFDTIIHNAGVYQSSLQEIFTVNVLAPYILTALIEKPKRLIYIGSNMHPQGSIDIEHLSIKKGADYSTSKLMLLMLALIVSKKYKDVLVNTVDPGWVKTKMANYDAPDSLLDGSQTQVWLASANDITFSGKYFYHLKGLDYSSKADDINMQEMLIQKYEQITGITLPI